MSTLACRGQHGGPMQMTKAFAGAVTVSIPIFALAAGTGARAVRDRLKKPGQALPGQAAPVHCATGTRPS
jgi:hypothetical protein